jgi:Domain of unknown function (DUF1707)
MTGELSPSGGPGELRASHADRDQVVEVLRVAAGDGRITADELDQRLEAALSARTLGELTALTTDLPASPARSAAAAAASQAKDLVRIDCGASTVRRDGPWVVPRRMEVQVTSGAVTLDFTEAVITQPVLEIDASVRGGALTLITVPGIDVDVAGVALRGGVATVRQHDGPAVATTLRVTVAGRVGSGVISAGPPRPPRRTFLQWLLRRPASPRPAITR